MSSDRAKGITSAVANQAKVQAAIRQANLDQVVAGTNNNVNPEASGGKSGSGGSGGGAQQQTPGHSQQSTFSSNADDATKAADPKGPVDQKPKKGVQRDVTRGKGGSAKPGAAASSPAHRGPRKVQRPGLNFKNKVSINSFAQSTRSMLGSFCRARGHFRIGITHLVSKFSLRSVLRGIARRAPSYFFKLLGGTLSVVLYVLDTPPVAAGGFPWWHERYRDRLSDFCAASDPAAKLNALRKMNVIIYTQQENDTKAFIAVMTGLGEVLRKDGSKRATVINQYRDLVKNYKKSLRAAGNTIAKNCEEGERLYLEVQKAYGWNQSYMQKINSYHYLYVTKFKKVSERYLNLACRIRDDVTAVSLDLK